MNNIKLLTLSGMTVGVFGRNIWNIEVEESFLDRKIRYVNKIKDLSVDKKRVLKKF